MPTRTLSRLPSNFLFSGKLKEPVVMLEYHFEDNPEYHDDGQSRFRTMQMLKGISQRYSGNLYLLLTAQKLTRPNLPDQVYDVFWKYQEFSSLKHVKLTVEVEGSEPVAFAVIDLEKFDFDLSEPPFVGKPRSLYVLSDYDLEALSKRISPWVLNKVPSEVISFDYDEIVSDLSELDPVAIFHYNFSHNGFYEAMSLVGPQNYLEHVVKPCIDDVCRELSVSVYE